MKNYFDNIIGNQHITKRLSRDVDDKCVSHALILEGASGSGRHTIAKTLAAAIECREKKQFAPCGKCSSCIKIFEDKSPDIITVEPERDRVQMGVDVIRKLREEAAYAPIDLAKKVFIIPHADVMNSQAQNAFLKILEEPPPHVMFLILCENTENLLSTIKSRAPIFRVETLDDDTVRTRLREQSSDAAELSQKDPEAFEAAVKLAHGSLGRAFQLTDPKHASECLEEYRKAERYIELLASRGDAARSVAFYEFSAKLASPKEREKLIRIYSLTADAVRDLINVKLAQSPDLIFYTSEAKAKEMADKYSISRLMRLTDVFSDAAASLSRNVNVSLAQTSAGIAASKA